MAGKNGKVDEDTHVKPERALLQRLERQTVLVPIVGVTPLIGHKWSSKAKASMLDAQQGKKVKQRAAKNPEEEFEAATYKFEDGRYGHPATAFKAALVGAVRYFDGLTITATKGMVYVHGDVGQECELLVPIAGERTMREDTPRNASGVCDLRYRPSFWPWEATLRIEWVVTSLLLDDLLSLVDAAGMTQGVGDWRPSSPRSSSGTYGQWRLDATRDPVLVAVS